jgi:hypothetical protein
MSALQHYPTTMTAAQVEEVLAGGAVEVYPENDESRTVVPAGAGLGPVNGHYRFCFLRPEHLNKLLDGEEVVVESYDDRYHLTVSDPR